MDYLFKNKLTYDPAAVDNRPDVLMAVPDFDLFALYALHCSSHSLKAVHVPTVDAITKVVPEVNPRLIVVDIADFTKDRALDFLEQRRKAYSHIPMVTVGFGLELEFLHKLLESGVVQHINRRFTRPQDVPVIIKTFLV